MVLLVMIFALIIGLGGRQMRHECSVQRFWHVDSVLGKKPPAGFLPSILPGHVIFRLQIFVAAWPASAIFLG